MKKVILSALAVFAFGITNAQEVKFGIKGGLNLSSWSGDTEGVNLKYKPGFNGGMFADVKLSEKVSLQPEVLYSLVGTKVDNFTIDLDGNEFTGDVNFNMSYIYVPVMLKLNVAEKFNLEVGPQVGFLVSAKSVVQIEGNSQEIKNDIKEIFNTVDFGVNFGAAYDLDQHFVLGIRYNLGLSNINKNEEGDSSKVNNSVFSLGLGYKF
ncbi:porin family protein [Flavobacterium sp. FBOR7N2.3]|uniref:Porin family protein n=1 Tax=Flavobacterium magnesitis TaxID=3138077 RepID=A0ABV4TJ05_9FLAO